MCSDRFKNKLAAVILAAGLGSRMKSMRSKVLCNVRGEPMVFCIVKLAVNIAGLNTIVVVGHQAKKVKKTIASVFNVKFAYQEKQMGTGHAVLCSVPLIKNNVENVVILCADVPLLTVDTVQKLIHSHLYNDNDISVLAVKVKDPFGYGRVFLDKDCKIERIVEESEIDGYERNNRLVNAGVLCVKRVCLKKELVKIKKKNKKNEIYLTDIVKIGYYKGLKIGVYISGNSNETFGVNTFDELKTVESLCDLEYI